jgi:hypothetical protein
LGSISSSRHRQGKLRFAAYDGFLNAGVFIDFCRRLLHDA